MNIHLKKFVEKKFRGRSGMAYDLGYGNGEDMDGLKAMGWKVEGFDKINGFDLNYGLYPKGDADLVYSNFCIQFIKDEETFIDNCYGLLKPGGLLFIQTMDVTDEIMKQFVMAKEELEEYLKDQFTNIKIRKFKEYDPEHAHTHVVLEATAKKKETDDGSNVSATAHHESLR